MSDLILPTEEQVERGAAAICNMLGQNASLMAPAYTNEVRSWLTLFLNKDKILGDSNDLYADAGERLEVGDLVTISRGVATKPIEPSPSPSQKTTYPL